MLHLNKKAEIQVLATRDDPDLEVTDVATGVSQNGIVRYVIEKLLA